MNFFFILMKNGTGINKTGQHVLVSCGGEASHAFAIDSPFVCCSDTFSTHIGHETKGKGKKISRCDKTENVSVLHVRALHVGM
jgi:hypothetical protein